MDVSEARDLVSEMRSALDALDRCYLVGGSEAEKLTAVRREIAAEDALMYALTGVTAYLPAVVPSDASASS